MAVRPPSLRSVAAFEAAARHESFTRAAAELNLTTGAVSHAIRALETRLDCALFTRAGRGVALTPAGQSLAASVRLSLALLGDAFDVAPWRKRDRLVVSAMPSVVGKVLLPALGTLRSEIARTVLDLRCTSALADLVEDVDVAVRFGPGGWTGVQSRFLAGERLFPVVSPAYRGGDLPGTLAALRACELIAHPESSWRLWLDPLGASPADFPSILSVDDSALVLEAAIQGHGIALARARLAQADLASGRLVRLLDHDVPAEYSYWAVWNGSTSKGALIEAFVGWASAVFNCPQLEDEAN